MLLYMSIIWTVIDWARLTSAIEKMYAITPGISKMSYVPKGDLISRNCRQVYYQPPPFFSWNTKYSFIAKVLLMLSDVKNDLAF